MINKRLSVDRFYLLITVRLTSFKADRDIFSLLELLGPIREISIRTLKSGKEKFHCIVGERSSEVWSYFRTKPTPEICGECPAKNRCLITKDFVLSD